MQTATRYTYMKLLEHFTGKPNLKLQLIYYNLFVCLNPVVIVNLGNLVILIGTTPTNINLTMGNIHIRFQDTLSDRYSSLVTSIGIKIFLASSKLIKFLDQSRIKVSK